MNRPAEMFAAANYYDAQYDLSINSGVAPDLAQSRAVDSYLDGKPRLRGKKKITRTERDAAFWSSALIEDIPVAAWGSDGFLLALSDTLDRSVCRIFLYWNASQLPLQKHLGVQFDTQDSFCVRIPRGDKN